MPRYTLGQQSSSPDTPGATRRKPRGKPRPVYVSLYAPSGRRTWWWYSYRCRDCGAYQLGRARQLDQVTGVRRAGCGHLVGIVISRTYGPPEAA